MDSLTTAGRARRKAKNATRQMWSHDEDAILLRIVQERGKTKWGLVADELRRRMPQSAKSGKQCRERYRNYLDPQIGKKEWTKSDKTVFLLLHKQYGNRWGQIAKYFVGRSDISLKNLFYSFVRRALRALRDDAVPCSMLSKPRKILESYYVADVIQNKYLPAIQQGHTRPADEKNERILLSLIKEKNVSTTMIADYKKNLVRLFKESNAKSVLPLLLWITTDTLNLTDSRFDKFKSFIAEQNFGELSSFISLRILPECDHPAPPVAPLQYSFAKLETEPHGASASSEEQKLPTIQFPFSARMPIPKLFPSGPVHPAQQNETSSIFSPFASFPCSQGRMIFWPMMCPMGRLPMAMPGQSIWQNMEGMPRLAAGGENPAPPTSYEPERKVKVEEYHSE
ncbi:MAG: Myb-like DNA-binding domain-containing protein [Candidatus Pacebacteria bacterium]|nr:Myb-like DNA-binding domain-containing protein [Candidatus Paceibacterota bacterium]